MFFVLVFYFSLARHYGTAYDTDRLPYSKTTNSDIFEWNEGGKFFQHAQTFVTHGALDLETWNYNGETFLVVANAAWQRWSSQKRREIDVTSSVASSDTETTVTHTSTVGATALNVGDLITISGHTGDAAALAMNQQFTVKTVNSFTETVLTGTGLTPGTYTDGPILLKWAYHGHSGGGHDLTYGHSEIFKYDVFTNAFVPTFNIFLEPGWPV